MSGQDELDIEKYKFLFDYFKSQYEIAMQSYHKLEDKAAKYLTLLAILVTAYSLIAKTIFLDTVIECKWYYFILYFLMLLTLVAIGSAWRYIFNCISLNQVARMPNEQPIVDWVNENTRAGVYLGLVSNYQECIKVYEEHNKIRTENLNNAFKEIKFSGLVFGISLLYLIIIKSIL